MKHINNAGLLITTLALAGFTQIAGAVTFPTSAGLFLYDATTGETKSGTSLGGGAYLFAGSIGGYTLTVSVGQTVTGGTFPSLDLDVAAAQTTTGDTLEIFYSDGSFGPTKGTYALSTTGPAFGGPVSTSAYLGTTYFDQSTLLGGSTDNSPYTLNAAGNIDASSYYLTIEDVITGNVVSVDSKLSTVPEPSTLVAALLMLLPLGMSASRCLRRDRTA